MTTKARFTRAGFRATTRVEGTARFYRSAIDKFPGSFRATTRVEGTASTWVRGKRTVSDVFQSYDPS